MVGEENTGNQSEEDRLEARMREVDEKYSSPRDRAEAVLTDLIHHTGDKYSFWDFACFSAEFLAQISLSPGWEWAQQYVKPILSRFYAVHYVHAEEFYKEEEEQEED